MFYRNTVFCLVLVAFTAALEKLPLLASEQEELALRIQHCAGQLDKHAKKLLTQPGDDFFLIKFGSRKQRDLELSQADTMEGWTWWLRSWGSNFGIKPTDYAVVHVVLPSHPGKEPVEFLERLKEFAAKSEVVIPDEFRRVVRTGEDSMLHFVIAGRLGLTKADGIKAVLDKIRQSKVSPRKIGAFLFIEFKKPPEGLLVLDNTSIFEIPNADERPELGRLLREPELSAVRLITDSETGRSFFALGRDAFERLQGTNVDTAKVESGTINYLLENWDQLMSEVVLGQLAYDVIPGPLTKDAKTVRFFGFSDFAKILQEMERQKHELDKIEKSFPERLSREILELSK